MVKEKKSYLYVTIIVIFLIILAVFLLINKNREVYTEKEAKTFDEINSLGRELDSLGSSISELNDEIDITT